MRFLCVFAIILIVGFVLAENNNWGTVNPLDNLLHREILYARKKFLEVVTRDYTWPPAGTANNVKITAIKAIDQNRDGTGGYVSLLNGGVDSTSVSFHLKSQRGHGFNFIIEIYGR